MHIMIFLLHNMAAEKYKFMMIFYKGNRGGQTAKGVSLAVYPF